jgi:hypothetical protein
MSLGGLLLGIINIAIIVAIFLLIGAIILWFCSWIGFAVPDMVRKLYIAVVALIALYMLVALLLGLPTWRVVRSNIPVGPEPTNWQPHIIAPEQRS